MTESNQNLTFQISTTNRNLAVHIEDTEFYLVFRKKVNATAIGPHEKRITDIGKDIGKENYKDVVPTTPPVMPNEFRELYKA